MRVQFPLSPPQAKPLNHNDYAVFAFIMRYSYIDLYRLKTAKATKGFVKITSGNPVYSIVKFRQGCCILGRIGYNKCMGSPSPDTLIIFLNLLSGKTGRICSVFFLHNPPSFDIMQMGSSARLTGSRSVRLARGCCGSPSSKQQYPHQAADQAAGGGCCVTA